RDRFLASLDLVPDEPPLPHRVQDRRKPQPPGPRGTFGNTPDTDTSVAANRSWGAEIRARMGASDFGRRTAEEGVVTSEAELDELIARTVEAGKVWRELGADRRAEILHAAGDVLQSRRADLLEVMGSECG